MSRSEATLGGESSESPPPVAPGEGAGRPFYKIQLELFCEIVQAFAIVDDFANSQSCKFY